MKTHRMLKQLALAGALLALAVPGFAADGANPFLGSFALTIPGGGAGWLGVEEKEGKLAASILWGGGSVVPWPEAKVDGDKLIVSRTQKDRQGNVTTEAITATLDGDNLKLTQTRTRADGTQIGKADFTGKRLPPPPAAPDLTKVKYGAPVTLFGGQDLTGWKLTNPNGANGWSVKDGVLTNNPVQEQGQPRKNYSNLRTERELEDFNLTLDVMVPPGGNSGIYLRGIYEIQVSDSFGRPVDSHNMGGVYSRIAPSKAVEKKAGEWQTFDITLVDRHVTVILNGEKIIDNKPLLGCTGGALWSDPFRPGPIYLQGDHTGVSYRNIVLKPVVK